MTRSNSAAKVTEAPAERGGACLCLLGPGGALVQSWHIGVKPMAFGRGSNADVCLDDESLSRGHFLLTHEGHEYFVIDLGSENGTWLRGEKVTARRLSHGDVIRAGQSLFYFSNSGLTLIPEVTTTAMSVAGVV